MQRVFFSSFDIAIQYDLLFVWFFVICSYLLFVICYLLFNIILNVGIVIYDDGLMFVGVYAGSNGINWTDALSYCERNFGTSLASIHDINSQVYASNAAYSATPYSEELTHEYAWIGLNDYYDKNGNWSWSDGTNFNFSYWGSGEPNGNTVVGSNCTQLAGLSQSRYPLENGINGPWNDAPCSWLTPAFICNRPNGTGINICCVF